MAGAGAAARVDDPPQPTIVVRPPPGADMEALRSALEHYDGFVADEEIPTGDGQPQLFALFDDVPLARTAVKRLNNILPTQPGELLPPPASLLCARFGPTRFGDNPPCNTLFIANLPGDPTDQPPQQHAGLGTFTLYTWRSYLGFYVKYCRGGGELREFTSSFNVHAGVWRATAFVEFKTIADAWRFRLRHQDAKPSGFRPDVRMMFAFNAWRVPRPQTLQGFPRPQPLQGVPRPQPLPMGDQHQQPAVALNGH